MGMKGVTVGSRITIRGFLGRVAKDTVFRTFEPTRLILNLKLVATGKRLGDHVWINNLVDSSKLAHLEVGTIVTISGTVYAYPQDPRKLGLNDITLDDVGGMTSIDNLIEMCDTRDKTVAKMGGDHRTGIRCKGPGKLHMVKTEDCIHGYDREGNEYLFHSVECRNKYMREHFG